MFFYIHIRHDLVYRITTFFINRKQTLHMKTETIKSITIKQKKHLIKLSHQLRPFVYIGQAGLTENVLAEIGNALESHELVKTKILHQNKSERMETINQIVKATRSINIHTIGGIVILYKHNIKKSKITLPN